MKYIYQTLFFVLLLFTPSAFADDYALSAKEVQQYLDANSAILIDVRDKEVFREGHIPGSISMPWEQIPKNMKTLDRKKRLIVIAINQKDAFGYRHFFFEQAFDAYYLRGGFQAWEKAGFKLEKS